MYEKKHNHIAKVILGLVCVAFIVLSYIFVYPFFLSALRVTSPLHKINWQKHHVVVFESDDWGGCRLFAKPQDLDQGVNYIPFKFRKRWGDLLSSTLESPSDLDKLFQLLLKNRGADGIPASITANYIMFNPEYKGIKAKSYAHFVFRQIPGVPNRWFRGNFVKKAKEGVSMGVWSPEYHGTLHMDPWRWMELLRKRDKPTLKLFVMESYAGMNGFNSPEYAQSLSDSQQRTLVKRGLKAFKATFGFSAHSSIAPYYQWQMRTEKILAKRGIKAIQGKRKQAGYQRPFFDKIAGKILNLMGYKSADKPWQINPGDYNVKLGIIYLVRNAKFEPIRFGARAVNEALTEIRKAWAKGEPAIVSTHRFNYVTHDETTNLKNLVLLDSLLRKIKEMEQNVLFLTDWELIQLYLRGYSVRRFGNKLVIRNFSEVPKIVAIEIPDNQHLEEFCAGPLDTPAQFISATSTKVKIPAQSNCILKITY